MGGIGAQSLSVSLNLMWFILMVKKKKFEAVSGHNAEGDGWKGWDYRPSDTQGAASGPAVACCLQEIRSQVFFLSSPCALLSASSQLYFNAKQTQRLGAEVCAGRLTLTVTWLSQKSHRSVESCESALQRRSRHLLSALCLIWSSDSTAKTFLIDIPCSGWLAPFNRI